MMRAIGINRHGGADVLQNLKIPDPVPGKNEVTVRIACASINAADIMMREGKQGFAVSMPHILGSDAAGNIEKIGGDVEGYAVGDKVLVNTLDSCGKCDKCKRGDRVSCASWRTLGLHTDGTYAEYVKVPAHALIKPPDYFSVEELACMPISLAIAWRSLITLGKGKKGETVVVRAASGNSGIFIVLLAKALGLNVVALSRGGKKIARLKGIGADHVVDPTSGINELAGKISEITGGLGADIVTDAMGSTLNDSITLARHSGRIISFGMLTGNESNINIVNLYRKGVAVFGAHNENTEALKEAVEFFAMKKIKPVICKELKLEDAKEGQRLLESGESFGKILLKP